MTDVIQVVTDYDVIKGGCQCCAEYTYYWVLPDGRRFLEMEEVLAALLLDKGVRVEVRE